jgi:hypothetical protein
MHQHVVFNALETLSASIEEGLNGSTVHDASEREIPDEQFGPTETDLLPDSIQLVGILEIHEATQSLPRAGARTEVSIEPRATTVLDL